jgi:hypothetical protein
MESIHLSRPVTPQAFQSPAPAVQLATVEHWNALNSLTEPAAEFDADLV